MEEIERSVENRVTILELELGIANEKIQRLESTITDLFDHVHTIGNLASGKVGAKELEVIVNQLVKDELKRTGVQIVS